jgi:hypothetical protein
MAQENLAQLRSFPHKPSPETLVEGGTGLAPQLRFNT